MEKTFRDDDINKYTDVNTLIRIQKLFDEFNKIHTVSVLMEDLQENFGVWYWLMTTPNIDIALHGWRHEDYSSMPYSEILNNLKRCLGYWRVNSARGGYVLKPIKVFYPPWNKTSDLLVLACQEVGLELRVDGDYCFHWWEFIGGRNITKLVSILSDAREECRN